MSRIRTKYNVMAKSPRPSPAAAGGGSELVLDSPLGTPGLSRGSWPCTRPLSRLKRRCIGSVPVDVMRPPASTVEEVAFVFKIFTMPEVLVRGDAIESSSVLIGKPSIQEPEEASKAETLASPTLISSAGSLGESKMLGERDKL